MKMNAKKKKEKEAISKEGQYILIWQASKCSPDMSPSLHMNFPFRANMKRLKEGIFDALFYSAADRREGNFTPLCKWFILSVSASHLETFSPSVTGFFFFFSSSSNGALFIYYNIGSNGLLSPDWAAASFSRGWNVFRRIEALFLEMDAADGLL